MNNILSFRLYEYLDLKATYYLNDKKIQIVDTQRRSDETVYKCMYEDGTTTQITLSPAEADEYFIPCPEPFALQTHPKRVSIKPKPLGQVYYDVVLCVQPNKVQQVLKPGLLKDRAFAMMNYFKKECSAFGKYPQFRPQWIQVMRSK